MDDLASGFSTLPWEKYPVLGNYVVQAKLGEGGMGQVFKAEHVKMRRIVALKVLLTARMSSPHAIKRFEREVKAAARLFHPNIVAAYDADEHHGIHFLVMEFVDGQDLSSVVQTQGPLSPMQAAHYLLQTARGLDYAHRQGVIHRDIKPSNLLVDRRNTVKILDMGLARIEHTVGDVDDGLTTCGQIVGTLDYLAPEQALDARVADARSDIYSLGCTLHYLLMGRVVFDEDTMTKKLFAHREQPVVPLRQNRPDVPEALDAIYQRMLAKHPEDRPQTAADLITLLETRLPTHVPSEAPVMPEMPPTDVTLSAAGIDFDSVAASMASVELLPLPTEDHEHQAGHALSAWLPFPCPEAVEVRSPSGSNSEDAGSNSGSRDSTSTILLVEDDLLNRRLMRASLEKRGYRVLEAATGTEGLWHAAEHDPDLLVLDLGLPDRDGLDMIHRVRRWSHVPILVVSAEEGEQGKITALDAGADDFLSKPFSIPELLARVRAMLRRRGREGSSMLSRGMLD